MQAHFKPSATLIMQGVLVMDYSKLDHYLEGQRKAGIKHISAEDKSEAYLAAIEPFHLENQRLNQVLPPYVNRCQPLFEAQKKAVVRWEYGRGGLGHARGCYYPCPVSDLIVGGFDRGKLLKRLKGAKPPDYVFGFNQKDQLVIVEWYTGERIYEQEVIFYEGQESQSIRFRDFKPGLYMSDSRKCVYDGDRLVFMETAKFDTLNKVAEFQIDEYTYSEDGIQTYSCFLFIPATNLASHRVYGFSHDQEGYLTEYWPIWNNGTAYQDPHIYTITKKRKV